MRCHQNKNTGRNNTTTTTPDYHKSSQLIQQKLSLTDNETSTTLKNIDKTNKKLLQHKYLENYFNSP